MFFLTIGALGAMHIPDAPQVLRAFDPRAGLRFLLDHGWIGFVVLGSVFLAVTGAEALYADMGHFGRLPIQVAWTVFVLPALLLNYLGQGALILSQPGSDRQSVLPARARLGAAAAGHSVDGGDGDRQPGGRSPAPSRWRVRRSSSACCRVSRSPIPRRRRRARFTSAASTGCC